MSLRSRLGRLMRAFLLGPARPALRSLLSIAVLETPLIHGDAKRVTIDPSAHVANMLFHTGSGTIRVEADVLAGHNVALVTGTHDYRQLGHARHLAFPADGCDIVIAAGVWLGTGATVLGPCRVGAHSVVAAGALVRSDVPDYAIVAGVPARVVGDVRESAPRDA